jgi:hypothetical protein
MFGDAYEEQYTGAVPALVVPEANLCRAFLISRTAWQILCKILATGGYEAKDCGVYNVFMKDRRLHMLLSAWDSKLMVQVDEEAFQFLRFCGFSLVDDYGSVHDSMVCAADLCTDRPCLDVKRVTCDVCLEVK